MLRQTVFCLTADAYSFYGYREQNDLGLKDTDNPEFQSQLPKAAWF